PRSTLLPYTTLFRSRSAMDGGNPDGLTHVACLTPPGQGAIATLALHGPGAWDALRPFFHPRKGDLPSLPQPQCFWLGRLGDDLRDRKSTRLNSSHLV